MPVDLEKVSRVAAVNRGVEVFIELTMFYGLLMAIAVWDLSRRARESKSQLQRLELAEQEQERLEAAFEKIKAKKVGLAKPCEENERKLIKLKEKVATLEQYISTVDTRLNR